MDSGSWPPVGDGEARSLSEPVVDPRRRRTRAKLHTAILELAAGWPVTDLSMVEVSAAAGVQRTTVYRHAASPVELLRQALTAELDESRVALLGDARTDPVRAVSDVVLAVLMHVERHAPIYRRGLASEGSAAGLEPMLSEHFRRTSDLLREGAILQVAVPVEGVPSEVVADAAHHFLAHGTVGVITAWLRWPELSAADFMRTYLALVPEWWSGPLLADLR